MKVVSKGTANKRDLVHATCKHCGTVVTFWRGEKKTSLDYIMTDGNDDMARFWAKWKCPVCEVEQAVTVRHVTPIYTGTFVAENVVEKDRVMTPEEKEEMERTLK